MLIKKLSKEKEFYKVTKIIPGAYIYIPSKNKAYEVVENLERLNDGSYIVKILESWTDGWGGFHQETADKYITLKFKTCDSDRNFNLLDIEVLDNYNEAYRKLRLGDLPF